MKIQFRVLVASYVCFVVCREGFRHVAPFRCRNID
jgi:hypothetical protein